ncbi:hypothetical protein Syun_018210 [Stephania yunnanensis]|uniref:Uncharacterized protein n=1 Tax=Stephania yunnanensis TaxID=152371 RepID=A0AAP0NVL4_9MAGN
MNKSGKSNRPLSSTSTSAHCDAADEDSSCMSSEPILLRVLCVDCEAETEA